MDQKDKEIQFLRSVINLHADSRAAWEINSKNGWDALKDALTREAHAMKTIQSLIEVIETAVPTSADKDSPTIMDAGNELAHMAKQFIAKSILGKDTSVDEKALMLQAIRNWEKANRSTFDTALVNQ